MGTERPMTTVEGTEQMNTLKTMQETVMSVQPPPASVQQQGGGEEEGGAASAAHGDRSALGRVQLEGGFLMGFLMGFLRRRLAAEGWVAGRPHRGRGRQRG